MPEFDINKETEEIKKLYGDRFNKSVEEYLTGEELREEANRLLDYLFKARAHLEDADYGNDTEMENKVLTLVRKYHNEKRNH